MTQKKVYEFKKDLATSQAEQAAAGWYKIYELMFRDFNNMAEVKDRALQAKQVDRILLLDNGAELRIEEKVDKYDNQRIALEMWADTEHSRAGWLSKPSLAHWIAYKKVALGECLFLPPNALKNAYMANKEKWGEKANLEIEDFKVGRAQNKGYSSINLLVPIKELLKTVKEARLIKYKDV